MMLLPYFNEVVFKQSPS